MVSGAVGREFDIAEIFLCGKISAESGGLVDTVGSSSAGGCEFESWLKLFNFLQIT